MTTTARRDGARLAKARPTEAAAFVRGEARTIARIRMGVERVVRRFRPWNAEQRREMIQESIVRVFVCLRRGRFRGEASLRTFAQTVARNVCLEEIRRRDGLLARALDDPDGLLGDGDDPERALLRDERHRRDVEAFAALPPESREMLIAIFVEGLSYAEVAERFGVSENGVKSRVFRSRSARRAAAAAEGGRRTET